VKNLVYLLIVQGGGTEQDEYNLRLTSPLLLTCRWPCPCLTSRAGQSSLITICTTSPLLPMWTGMCSQGRPKVRKGCTLYLCFRRSCHQTLLPTWTGMCWQGKTQGAQRLYHESVLYKMLPSNLAADMDRDVLARQNPRCAKTLPCICA